MCAGYVPGVWGVGVYKATVEMGEGQSLRVHILCVLVSPFMLQLPAVCTLCSFRFVCVNRQWTLEWPSLFSHFYITCTSKRTLVKLFHCLHDLQTYPVHSYSCTLFVFSSSTTQTYLNWGSLCQKELDELGFLSCRTQPGCF